MASLSLPTATVIEHQSLRLRQGKASDLEAVIELQTDGQVREHLGGPRPPRVVRERLATHGVESVTAEPGSFIVAGREDDQLLGMVVLDRRAITRPGHVVDDGGELELSYVFRRRAWGQGRAVTACRALLQSAAAELADQPVLVVTQAANTRARRVAGRLGFAEVLMFEEYDSVQMLATTSLQAFAESS